MNHAIRIARQSWTRVGVPALLGLGLGRFAVTAYTGLTTTVGDFYQTLPGAYVRTVNPVLWNSPDLTGSAAYQREIYLYGPSQYLTLYPLAYLPSYRQIAMWLLGLYAMAIVATIVVLWKTMAAGEAGRPPGVAPAACAALLFTPLLQCYVQREFETIAFLIWSIGAYCLVRRRDVLGGTAFGYVAWFKLLPLGFLPYLVLRRWFKATLAFICVSVAVLALTQALFGLDKFLMFSSRLIGQESAAEHIVGAQIRPLFGERAGFYLDRSKSPGYIGTGFCDDWNETNDTIVSVRWGLCGLNMRHAWLPSRELFYLFVAVVGGCFVTAFVAHERRTPAPLEAKWRTIWELSLVLMVTIVVVRAHYYYLISLLFPIVALVYRYLQYGSGRIRIALLVSCYVILSAFVVPVSILSRLLDRNVWHDYMQHDVYLYGELMLFSLLLWEYWPRPVVAAPRSLP